MAGETAQEAEKIHHRHSQPLKALIEKTGLLLRFEKIVIGVFEKSEKTLKYDRSGKAAIIQVIMLIVKRLNILEMQNRLTRKAQPILQILGTDVPNKNKNILKNSKILEKM